MDVREGKLRSTGLCSTFKYLLFDSPKSLTFVLLPFFLAHRACHLVAGPSHLTHLSRVPTFEIFVQLFQFELEDQRIGKIILPYETAQGIVLIWALGKVRVTVVRIRKIHNRTQHSMHEAWRRT